MLGSKLLKPPKLKSIRKIVSLKKIDSVYFFLALFLFSKFGGMPCLKAL